MWPRWVRTLTTIWVAIDSHKRGKLNVAWVLTILLLGPLLIPLYMASRPALKGEKRINFYLWRLMTACENLVFGIFGLATSAVFIENITTPRSKDIAEVKRAEIKAGTIAGTMVIVFVAAFVKFTIDFLREHIENRYLS